MMSARSFMRRPPGAAVDRVAMLLASVVMACDGSSDGKTTEPPIDPPSGSTTVRLTLTTRSLNPAFRPGYLFTYVGTTGESRSRMAALLNVGAPTVGFIEGPERTETITVPKGTVVTIFAVEVGRAGGFARAGNNLLRKTPEVSATEFVDFTGATGQTTETGVLSVTMDADKMVVARYDLMQGMVVQARGCPSFKTTWQGPGYLGFGTLDPNSEQISATKTDNTPTMDEQVFSYAKQNTIFTLTAQTRDMRAANEANTGFMRWEGAASSCGTNIACNVPVAARGAAFPIVQMVNSYVVEPSSLTGSGCGGCTSTQGACGSEFVPRMRP